MDHLQNGVVDEDAFLTQLESKLRGPFSSLDLAKAVSQAALTESVDSKTYLEQVAAVLSRAEKVTQLRLLVGLLGLDTMSAQNDAAIRTILESAQEAPIYDDWVRVIAGIVQSTLFGEEQQGNGESIKSEAQEVMDKTCRQIIGRVRKVERATAVIDEDTEHRLGQSDADPTLAHYRYSLIAPELLLKIIPEIESHDHFQVDEGADILLMDAKLELERKKEEEEYQQTGVTAAAATADKKQSEQPASSAPDFPGFQSVSSKAKARQPPKKSSLFIPAKRPSAAAGGAKRTLGGTKPALKPVQRTGLHQRKAGAAQALLGKSRRVRGAIAGAGAAGTTPGVGAAASKMAQARSKMKMIAVEEVQGLEQSKKQEQTNANATILGRKGQLLAGKKRNKPDGSSAAQQPKSKVARQRTNQDVDDGEDSKPAAKAEPTAALATAALTAYQAQKGSSTKPPMPQQQQRPPVANMQQPPQHHKQQDWRDLLQEKNNRLSPEDHARIAQFFTNHFNPTPDQLTYKMKLHEERTQDPKTGEPVKETYYLELDYQTFTSKQSKKVKRY